MQKHQWIKTIREQTSTKASPLTASQVEAVIEANWALIAQQMASGEEIRWLGFGTFAAKRIPARSGRNPQTGLAIKLPATTRVSFKAASALKAAVQPKPAKAKRQAAKAVPARGKKSRAA